MLWHLLTESNFTDSDVFITNIVVLWPGSTHDSHMACLLAPILKPKNAGEVRYNTAHRRTRCLHLGLRTALANTLVIIMTTAVLHNFALIHLWHIEDDHVLFDIVTAVGVSSNAKRHLIISRCFAYNRINDLIKLHVRFIDTKIKQKKRNKTFTPINLINPLILLF